MFKNKILKIIVTIFINILVIILFLFCFDFIVYKFLYPKLEGYKKPLFPYSLKKERTDIEKLAWLRQHRNPLGLNYKNGGIILFGCSFAYGHLLADEETFAGRLSEKLKRPAYNLASSGYSPQFALMDIQSGKYDELIKNADYVFFVVIGEHVYRVHANSSGFYCDYVWPRYVVKKINNKIDLVFKEQKFPFIEGSYTYKYFRKLLYAKLLMPSNNQKIKDYMFDFVKLHFLKINEELKKRNPQIKFWVIVYQDQAETRPFTYNERWKELEDVGIGVFNVGKELPDVVRADKYFIPNDGHPTEVAWEEITDYMVNTKKLF